MHPGIMRHRYHTSRTREIQNDGLIFRGYCHDIPHWLPNDNHYVALGLIPGSCAGKSCDLFGEG